MKNYNIIILGGGACGIITSIIASNKHNNIAIIDKCNKLAKKILVTGNGRCNLTNVNATSKHYNQNIDKYLNRFNVQDTLKFFSDLGLMTYNDEENRIYPISNSAKSVLDVLTNKVNSSNIDKYLEHEILNIERKNNKFIVETDKESFECEKLVVALGGNTSEHIAQKFNIKIKKFVPSLVSLKTNSTKLLNNTRVSNVKVTATNSQGNQMIEKGEVLFKDSGLSGICIFNLSTLFSRINNFNGKIEIDLLPDYETKVLTKILNERKKLNVKINQFFDGMFVSAIAYEILNRCKINENRLSSELSDKEIEQFVKIIKHLDFKVVGCYENNQVYSGGICLNELNDNLECKNIKGLYFGGEVCDIDGLCGGYNLQWAWTSGFIIGESL